MDDMHLKYFRINSWNGNLIFHQTRGVSWLNVSVSQATCQTWPLSNDDDGCSSLEQSVWWWSCIFFWWRAEFVLDSHVTVPEINILGTWKIDELTSILSPCLFLGGNHTPKIRSCEAKRSSKHSPTHCGRPKKDSLSSFCTRKLRCNVEFLSFPTCHRSSLSLGDSRGKSAWQGDIKGIIGGCRV